MELQSPVELGSQICVRAPKKQMHVKYHKVAQAGSVFELISIAPSGIEMAGKKNINRLSALIQ